MTTTTSWYALSTVVFEQHKLVERAWFTITDAATYLIQLHREHFAEADRGVESALLCPHQLPMARKIGTRESEGVFDWAICPAELDAILGDDGVLLRDDDPWIQGTSKQSFLETIDKCAWTRNDAMVLRFHNE